MKKRVVVIAGMTLILGLILVGCNGSNQGMNNSENLSDTQSVSQQTNQVTNQEKIKAMADVTSAQYIGMGFVRFMEENQIRTYDKEQKLTPESEYGKLLGDVPTSKVNSEFSFFITISSDGMVTVRVGKDASTAVKLFPKPEKYQAPYDIINE